MRTARLIRTFALAVIVAAALPSSAFDTDKPKGAQFFGEQSQEQVASQQALSGKLNEVGTVDVKAGGDTVNGQVGSAGANPSFGNANAEASLKTAAKQLKDAKHGSFPWLGIFLFCGVGILGAAVFKTFADKVPLPDSLKKRD